VRRPSGRPSLPFLFVFYWLEDLNPFAMEGKRGSCQFRRDHLRQGPLGTGPPPGPPGSTRFLGSHLVDLETPHGNCPGRWRGMAGGWPFAFGAIPPLILRRRPGTRDGRDDGTSAPWSRSPHLQFGPLVPRRGGSPLLNRRVVGRWTTISLAIGSDVCSNISTSVREIRRPGG